LTDTLKLTGVAPVEPATGDTNSQLPSLAATALNCDPGVEPATDKAWFAGTPPPIWYWNESATGLTDTVGGPVMVNVTGTLELFDPSIDAIVRELW
jgi:hypothetical protein